jgi:mycothiol synthase
VPTLDVRSLDRVRSIAGAAEARDGVAPLDEATLLTLRHHPDRARGEVRREGFALVIDHELSLVVAPGARGRGLGRSLLEDALADGVPAPLLAWSHGDHPAAARLAATAGFERVRELWVMRRPMSLPLDDLVVPADLEVRGFRPGDEEDLLRVNAAAFAAHPEQGSMDADNLAERMEEPWFDPAGLLVATDGERLLGFHWTKQHSEALGEVYVVGIDPAAQGRGLGKILTLAGLRHLADRGVEQVLLYTESDNGPAIAIYSRLGFTHEAADTHVMYRR